MPHLVLEHSAELGADRITATCEALFDAACASPIFTNLASIKIRSVPCHNVRMGTTPETFAHLTVWLLSGREQPFKQDLARALLTVMDSHLPEVGALSVDPRDMDTETYLKRVI